MSRSLPVYAILTEDASEIPSGVLTTGSFVTANLSTFLDTMLNEPTAIGLVNLADIVALESIERLEHVPNKRVFFYVPADRVKALDAEFIPVSRDAHLERQGEFYWVHGGGSFEHSLAVAQYAQDNAEEVVSLSKARHPRPSSLSSTNGLAVTSLPRVLLRLYPHFKKIAPNWLWKYSYRLARKILK